MTGCFKSCDHFQPIRMPKFRHRVNWGWKYFYRIGFWIIKRWNILFSIRISGNRFKSLGMEETGRYCRWRQRRRIRRRRRRRQRHQQRRQSKDGDNADNDDKTKTATTTMTTRRKDFFHFNFWSIGPSPYLWPFVFNLFLWRDGEGLETPSFISGLFSRQYKRVGAGISSGCEARARSQACTK